MKYEVFLTRNRVVEITYDEAIRLAKYIILIPDFKQFTLGGVTFSWGELDLEAKRLSKLPQQIGLDVRVKTIDAPVTRKQKREAMEEKYNKVKKIGKST